MVLTCDGLVMACPMTRSIYPFNLQDKILKVSKKSSLSLIKKNSKLIKKEIEDLNNNSFNNMSLNNEVFVDDTFPNNEKDKVITIYLNSNTIFVIQ